MNCRACRSTSLEFLCPVKGPPDGSFYRCNRCGSFTSDLTYGQVRHLYGPDPSRLTHGLDDFGGYGQVECGFQGHLANALSHPHSKSCLDVGCLDGAWLGMLAKRNYEVWGFDVEPSVREFASNHIGCPPEQIVIHHQLQRSLFPKLFGVVHCSEVIEHVDDPIALLAAMWELTEPGGLLILQSPLPNPDVEQSREGNHWNYWNQAAHLCAISKIQMSKLLAFTGWCILHNLTVLWDGGQLYYCEKTS